MCGADNKHFYGDDDDDVADGGRRESAEETDGHRSAASGRRERTTTKTGLQPPAVAAADSAAAAVVLPQLRVVALVVAPASSFRCSSGPRGLWWCVGATGCTARTTTAGCKLTGCGCCYLPAICCLAAVITSLSLMRSRAAAFTDANATADLVRRAAAGRDAVRDEDGVEAVTATAAVATAENATAFRRPLLPLPPPPPHHQPPPTASPPNQTNPAAADGDQVHHQPQSLGTVMVLMVVTVVVLGTVGLLTCVLHHYNQQYNPAVPSSSCLTVATPRPHHCRLSTPSPPPTKKNLIAPPLPPPPPPTTATVAASPPNGSCNSSACSTSSRTAMLTMRSNNAGLSREHDRQVRLHSVRTDLELDLPPRIHLPDGEEYPYGSTAKLHLRNSEQEQEIYQKCIKGPPNRTIWSSASECGKQSQPQRLNSAVSGLTSLSTFPSEVDSVTRCNSVSSRCLPRTGFPPVDNIQSLSSLTMVPCLSHVDKQTMSQ